MKWSLAVLVAVFLIGISVSDAGETDASQKADSSTISDGISMDQNRKEAGSSTTNYGTPVDQKPNTGPSAYPKTGEESFLATDGEPSKGTSLLQQVQKKLQKTVSGGWSWLSGAIIKSGKEAGRMLSLRRSPSDVNKKVDQQE